VYNDRFASTFNLPTEYSTPEYTNFAQAVTSNLIGGIGYYYGSSLVDRGFRHSHDDDGDDEDEVVETGVREEEPRELLTATPSRSFFPRGFYWDEGFHLAVVAEWDNDLSLEILKSWINLIDENGWVAREQILGEESRSKVSGLGQPRTLPGALLIC
jgi:mannosyl-oligosaccharide glucosidase